MSRYTKAQREAVCTAAAIALGLVCIIKILEAQN